jgi:hypothetical protein
LTRRANARGVIEELQVAVAAAEDFPGKRRIYVWVIPQAGVEAVRAVRGAHRGVGVLVDVGEGVDYVLWGADDLSAEGALKDLSAFVVPPVVGLRIAR